MKQVCHIIRYLDQLRLSLITAGMVLCPVLSCANDSSLNFPLISLGKSTMEKLKGVPRQAASEYFIEACRNEAGVREMGENAFPLFNKFTTIFFNPQHIILSPGWRILEHYADAYLIFSQDPQTPEFRRQAFLVSLILTKNYERIEKMLAVHKNLADAGFELQLVGAVAAPHCQSAAMDQCLEYALERYPAKTISTVLWSSPSKSPNNWQLDKLVRLIEAKPEYLDGEDFRFAILSLLSALTRDIDQRNSEDAMRYLEAKPVFQILKKKARGVTVTIKFLNNGKQTSISQDPDSDREFKIKIQKEDDAPSNLGQ